MRGTGRESVGGFWSSPFGKGGVRGGFFSRRSPTARALRFHHRRRGESPLGPPFSKGGKSEFVLVLVLLAACAPPADQVAVPGVDGAVKTAALARAERRAYDGAPPVIPHENFGITCTECHDLQGMEVADVGFAPPSPHEQTIGMSAFSRCRQCHVFSRTGDTFKGNAFAGLRQDLRRGARLNPFAPPTLPHKTFMRENCVACHSGPAAREEIRTDHPERPRCRQCHVPVETRAIFKRGEAS